MIAREWVGQTATADADSYMAFLRRTGLADYRRTPGNQGVLVLRRDRADDVSEFRLLSFWDSFDSIRSFAGPDVNKAYYYPDDPKYLLSLGDSITHYEVLESAGDHEEVRVDDPIRTKQV